MQDTPLSFMAPTRGAGGYEPWALSGEACSTITIFCILLICRLSLVELFGLSNGLIVSAVLLSGQLGLFDRWLHLCLFAVRSYPLPSTRNIDNKQCSYHSSCIYTWQCLINCFLNPVLPKHITEKQNTILARVWGPSKTNLAYSLHF